MSTGPTASPASPVPGDTTLASQAVVDSAAAGAQPKLRRRLVGQLGMLTVEFLLGTGVNLIGLPKENTGAAKVVTTILLTVHIAVAVGLIVGAILTVRYAARMGSRANRLSWTGAVLVFVTIIAGVLTMALGSNWWSYTMAVGFIASFLVYGMMLGRPGEAAPAPGGTGRG